MCHHFSKTINSLVSLKNLLLPAQFTFAVMFVSATFVLTFTLAFLPLATFTVQGVNIQRHKVWILFSNLLCAWCLPRLSSTQVVIEQLSHMTLLRRFLPHLHMQVRPDFFRRSRNQHSHQHLFLWWRTRSSVVFQRRILPVLHSLQELFLGSEAPSKNFIQQRQTPLTSFSADTIHAEVSSFQTIVIRQRLKMTPLRVLCNMPSTLQLLYTRWVSCQRQFPQRVSQRSPPRTVNQQHCTTAVQRRMWKRIQWNTTRSPVPTVPSTLGTSKSPTILNNVLRLSDAHRRTVSGGLKRTFAQTTVHPRTKSAPTKRLMITDDKLETPTLTEFRPLKSCEAAAFPVHTAGSS